MVALRGLALSHSKIPTMRVTPSLNSMAMSGRGACLRSVRIALQELQLVATELVVALGVAWVLVAALSVEAALGEVVLLEVGVEGVGASVVILTVVLPLVMMVALLLQVRSLRQILSQTMLRQEETVARPSTSAM